MVENEDLFNSKKKDPSAIKDEAELNPGGFGEGKRERLTGEENTSSNNDTPTMGSTPSYPYKPGSENEDMPGGLTAASTRFGDEFTGKKNAPGEGNSQDNDTFMANTRFGEELASRERNIYPTDTNRVNTDDLLDDNDALTENKASRKSNMETKEDKSLWEKLKDKASNLEDDIKKAFD